MSTRAAMGGAAAWAGGPAVGAAVFVGLAAGMLFDAHVFAPYRENNWPNGAREGIANDLRRFQGLFQRAPVPEPTSAATRAPASTATQPSNDGNSRPPNDGNSRTPFDGNDKKRDSEDGLNQEFEMHEREAEAYKKQQREMMSNVSEIGGEASESGLRRRPAFIAEGEEDAPEIHTFVFEAPTQDVAAPAAVETPVSATEQAPLADPALEDTSSAAYTIEEASSIQCTPQDPSPVTHLIGEASPNLTHSAPLSAQPVSESEETLVCFPLPNAPRLELTIVDESRIFPRELLSDSVSTMQAPRTPRLELTSVEDVSIPFSQDFEGLEFRSRASSFSEPQLHDEEGVGPETRSQSASSVGEQQSDADEPTDADSVPVTDPSLSSRASSSSDARSDRSTTYGSVAEMVNSTPLCWQAISPARSDSGASTPRRVEFDPSLASSACWSEDPRLDTRGLSHSIYDQRGPFHTVDDHHSHGRVSFETQYGENRALLPDNPRSPIWSTCDGIEPDLDALSVTSYSNSEVRWAQLRVPPSPTESGVSEMVMVDRNDASTELGAESWAPLSDHGSVSDASNESKARVYLRG